MDDAAFYQRIDLLDEDDVIDAESPVILDDGTGHSRLASALPVVRRVTALPFFGVVLYVQGALLATYVEHDHPLLGVGWIMLMIMATLTAGVWSLYNAWRR